MIHLHLDHYIMDKTLYSVINHSDPFFWRSTCSLQDDLTKLATDIFHLSIRQWVNGRTGGQQPTWHFPFTQRSIWSVPFVIIVSHIYFDVQPKSKRERERKWTHFFLLLTLSFCFQKMTCLTFNIQFMHNIMHAECTMEI